MATFIENGLFDRAAAKIAALKPCPFAGKVTADQIKLALGEWLDIWPASIADEVLANAIVNGHLASPRQ